MKKEESDVLQQSADAALQLFQTLQQLVEVSMKSCLQNMPEQIMQLSHQVHKIETKQQQSVYDFESIKQQLENLASVNKLLENASRINLLLSKQHYEDCIIQPMAMSLFAVIDLIEDSHKSQKDNNCQTGQHQAELIVSIRVQLEQFFQNYSIKVIRHQPGSQFNPQLMKPVSKVPATDKSLDGCIAESLQAGFIWNQQRLLRPESVSIYKFVRTHINPIKQENGGVS